MFITINNNYTNSIYKNHYKILKIRADIRQKENMLVLDLLELAVSLLIWSELPVPFLFFRLSPFKDLFTTARSEISL